MNIRNIAVGLFFVFLFLMPFNNIYEVYAMKQGLLPYGGWSIALTPITIKIYKDIFLIIFLSLIFALLLRSHTYRVYSFSYLTLPVILLLVLMAIFLITSLFHSDFVNAVLGVRAYINVAYIFIGLMIYPVLNKIKFNKILFILLMLQLSLQIYQYVDKQGLIVFAELRSPGFFIVPATAGMFSLLLYYLLPPTKTNLILCCLSLILSASTIGLVAFIFSQLYCFFNKFFAKSKELAIILFIVCSVIIALLLFNYGGVISGRGEGVMASFNARIDIISTNFLSSGIGTVIWGDGFGIATSQATLSQANEHVITDNTFLSLFLNMGFVAVLCYIFFIINLYFADRTKLIFFIVICYSATANIFELNPASALLFVAVGFVFFEYYSTLRDSTLSRTQINEGEL